MKISDITTGKANLENLLEKNRSKLLQDDSVKDGKVRGSRDGFESQRSVKIDYVRINELQKSYMKDAVSLQGLRELEKNISAFENRDEASRNFDSLSSELRSIIHSTRYEGESVISYLSASIKDSKSLYTFKSNLVSEIATMSGKLAEDRKKIATYLVKSENLEVARQFSPEKSAQDIASSIVKGNVKSLYKDLSNLNNLIGMDK